MGELPQIHLASLCDGENPWQGKEGREVCVQDKGGTKALGEGEIRRRMSLDPHPQESQTCSRCVCRSGAQGPPWLIESRWKKADKSLNGQQVAMEGEGE